jgi:hypothetical protein
MFSVVNLVILCTFHSIYHLFCVYFYYVLFIALASLVRYDLNITLGCHRFYYLAPLPVLDPILKKLTDDGRKVMAKAHVAFGSETHQPNELTLGRKHL